MSKFYPAVDTEGQEIAVNLSSIEVAERYSVSVLWMRMKSGCIITILRDQPGGAELEDALFTKPVQWTLRPPQRSDF